MVDGGGPGVDSRDERKHTGRNDLLFVKKMLWVTIYYHKRINNTAGVVSKSSVVRTYNVSSMPIYVDEFSCTQV